MVTQEKYDKANPYARKDGAEDSSVIMKEIYGKTDKERERGNP